MEFWDVVLTAANRKGISMMTICRENGWSDRYIAANKARGSLPKVDNATKILNACGYELAAIPMDKIPDDALVIDVERESGGQ